ncbi:MAG: Fe-S cluster assembly protein NifU [Phycisphaerae bacterium]|nr:Fe-S cluster assembly protein NifU [Phycisphaerae bacterium]
MWDYSEKVVDHFLNPRNVGEIDEPDGVGEVGSLACGDALKFTFKLGPDGRVADAKFKTFGCASAIASSSALTEMIKGMTLDEAEKVTNRDIAEFLGGLPEQKMHCSVMGREALELAIANYRGEGDGTKRELEGDVVCHCFGVTRNDIERVVRENKLTKIEEVTHYIKAGGGCENCHEGIQAIIDEVSGARRPDEARAPEPKKKLTNVQKIRLIEETIEREIRPRLRNDGGDVELIDVEGNRVVVGMRGNCANCKTAQFTIKETVEKPLREFVSDELVVVQEECES